MTPPDPARLNPPLDTPITTADLALADGSGPTAKAWVAIKGTVFDVTGNKAYIPGGSYHVFAGKDASRALAKSSVKATDVSAEYSDLDEKELKVLEEWFAFFSKRYNVIGKVVN